MRGSEVDATIISHININNHDDGNGDSGGMAMMMTPNSIYFSFII